MNVTSRSGISSPDEFLGLNSSASTGSPTRDMRIGSPTFYRYATTPLNVKNGRLATTKKFRFLVTKDSHILLHDNLSDLDL